MHQQYLTLKRRLESLPVYSSREKGIIAEMRRYEKYYGAYKVIAILGKHARSSWSSGNKVEARKFRRQMTELAQEMLDDANSRR